MTSSRCTDPMRKTISVFEHESLLVDRSGFTTDHFDRLVKLNERNGDRFFSVGHQRIKFRQFVGTIQVGGLTIEVLPKVGKVAEDDKETWRGVLRSEERRVGKECRTRWSPDH